MNIDSHRKERHQIIEAAILNGVESLKRSWTFFITAYPYTEASPTITSFSRSFSSGSSKKVNSFIRASREGGDTTSSVDMKGLGTTSSSRSFSSGSSKKSRVHYKSLQGRRGHNLLRGHEGFRDHCCLLFPLTG